MITFTEVYLQIFESLTNFCYFGDESKNLRLVPRSLIDFQILQFFHAAALPVVPVNLKVAKKSVLLLYSMTKVTRWLYRPSANSWPTTSCIKRTNYNSESWEDSPTYRLNTRLDSSPEMWLQHLRNSLNIGFIYIAWTNKYFVKIWFLCHSCIEQKSNTNLSSQADWSITCQCSYPYELQIDTILYFGDRGINRAIEGWGEIVTRRYGKSRAYVESDLTVNYVGYWTDNGKLRKCILMDCLKYVFGSGPILKFQSSKVLMF